MENEIYGLFDDLDPEQLREIDLSEEEIRAYSQDIEIETIKQNVFKRIRGNAKKSNARVWGRGLKLLVVASVMALGITVVGASYSIMKEIWGEDVNVPVDVLQQVKQSFVSEALTMHIEEAINTEHLQLLLISFTKNNGNTFEENETMEKIDVKGLGGSIPLYRKKYLSEDHKKLMYCIQGIKRTDQEEVYIEAQTLIREERDEQLNSYQATVVSEDGWGEKILLEETTGKSIKDVNLELNLEGQSYILDEVELSSIGLYIHLKPNTYHAMEERVWPKIELRTKDGAIRELFNIRATSSSVYGIGLQYDLILDQKEFIQLEQIETLIIEGQAFKLD